MHHPPRKTKGGVESAGVFDAHMPSLASNGGFQGLVSRNREMLSWEFAVRIPNPEFMILRITISAEAFAPDEFDNEIAHTTLCGHSALIAALAFPTNAPRRVHRRYLVIDQSQAWISEPFTPTLLQKVYSRMERA